MSKVHFISPYRTDRNIGFAINEAIEQLNANPNDWIVHNDQDTLWLLPDSKTQLISILNKTEYDLLGPTTNRLANHYQLFDFMFDESNIHKHIDLAKGRQSEYYGEVQPYAHVLAAFCLCFKVKTWIKLGKFTEKNITFDTDFSLSAHENGMKLGLMIGIYCLHLYRWGSSNPKYDIAHLI